MVHYMATLFWEQIEIEYKKMLNVCKIMRERELNVSYFTFLLKQNVHCGKKIIALLKPLLFT